MNCPSLRSGDAIGSGSSSFGGGAGFVGASAVAADVEGGGGEVGIVKADGDAPLGDAAG
jgi:hypothetical protein